MTSENKWKRKAEALARLAEDQRNKPEGDLAREKLLAIINKHPEAISYGPIVELVRRDMTLKDIAWMRQNGVSTDGRWEGDWCGGDFSAQLKSAIAKLEADYWQRIDTHKNRRYLQA